MSKLDLPDYYYVFTWISNSPHGGWGDYLGEVNTIDEAKKAVMRGVHDYAEIVNPRNKNIACTGYQTDIDISSEGRVEREWTWIDG